MASVASVKSAKSAANHQFVKAKKGVVEKDASLYLKKPSLYATVDGGRLHMAVDDQYAGSVDSYNNFITKFFANLFGWSTQVTVNGKTRHVNKADYAKWLANNTAGVEMAKGLDLNLIEVKAASGQGRMRDHISADKANRLFKKMVVALSVNKDVETAKKHAGKGANIDSYFWVRDNLPISFASLRDDLRDDKAIDFKAGHYTPLLYAAEKGQTQFVDFLLQLEANTEAAGEYVHFSKKILEVNPVTSVFKVEESNTTDGRKHTRVTLKTSTVLQIEDQLTPEMEIRFSSDTGLLTQKESRASVVIERYSKSIERYTTRYIS